MHRSLAISCHSTVSVLQPHHLVYLVVQVGEPFRLLTEHITQLFAFCPEALNVLGHSIQFLQCIISLPLHL